jgi:hypothetical protein
MTSLRRGPSGPRVELPAIETFSDIAFALSAGPLVNVLTLPPMLEDEGWNLALTYWGRVTGSVGLLALSRVILVSRPGGSIPLFAGQQDVVDGWPGGVWLTNPAAPGSAVLVVQFVPTAPSYDFVAVTATITSTPLAAP